MSEQEVKKRITLAEVRDALKSENRAGCTDGLDEVCRMAIAKLTDEEIKNAMRDEILKNMGNAKR